MYLYSNHRYFAAWDRTNPYDSNAVALYSQTNEEGRDTVAHMRRDRAASLSQMWSLKLEAGTNSMAALKPKSAPHYGHGSGMEQ